MQDLQNLDAMTVHIHPARLNDCAIRRTALSKTLFEELKVPCDELCLPLKPVLIMLEWYRRSLDSNGWYTGCISGMARADMIGMKRHLDSKLLLDESVMIPAIIPPWDENLRLKLKQAVARQRLKWSSSRIHPYW